ncbi:MAG: YciI family protein [Alphaproteobacteria bacterium]|nr:YciI family protein [Alphaproteobacteria bacterium]
MLWSIHCLDRPNGLELRMQTRPKHLEYLAAVKDKIMFCGPMMSENSQEMLGSLLIVNVASRAAAESFSENDPYAAAGLFESVVIRRLRKFMLDPALAQD